MSKHPGFYKSEKRRKELDRKKKHDKKLEEKKQRRAHENGESDILIVGDSDVSAPASDPAPER